MLRNVGALVIGLLVGMVVNMALISLNAYVLFPLPEGTDMSNMKQMRAYVSSLPVGAFLVVIAAHLGQAFVGGWVAARLSGSRPMLLAMIVGVLSLVGGIANFVNLQAPTWTVIEFPLYLVASGLAGWLEVRRR